MAEPFVGEIRMFAGSFAPAGWAFCDGQLFPIAENDVLYQLIGTTYGGDGQETFAVPNLQGRVPIHMGTGSFGTTYQLGEIAGVEQVTLTAQQIPIHSHQLMGTQNIATTNKPGDTVVPAVTAASTVTPYGTDAPLVTLHPNAVSLLGGSQPHENLQPYLCINFIISLFGIFPHQ